MGYRYNRYNRYKIKLRKHFIMMEIWVNEVGGDSDSEFSIDVSNGILHVGHLREAIVRSEVRQNAPERFGLGAVDIYTNSSATVEYKLSARDCIFINGRLKWTSLFFSQPVSLAQQGKKSII